jgi:hypothetical protein
MIPDDEDDRRWVTGGMMTGTGTLNARYKRRYTVTPFKKTSTLSALRLNPSRRGEQPEIIYPMYVMARPNVYVTTGVIRQMRERHVHYDRGSFNPTKERVAEWRFPDRTSYR